MPNMIGSTVGKWTVWVPPITGRRYDLRIFRRQHPGDAYFDIATQEALRVKNMEVTRFTMQEAPEGDFAPDGPAMTAGFNDDNEVFQFMQALVNEAAKLGIYASGTKDVTRELTATRNHLEDLRRIVFDPEHEQPYKELAEPRGAL